MHDTKVDKREMLTRTISKEEAVKFLNISFKAYPNMLLFMSAYRIIHWIEPSKPP
jgi:hypothetical protein